MALITCPTCSKRFSDTCPVCPQCGTNMSEYKRCRECGMLLKKVVGKCPNCGFDFVAEERAATEAYLEEQAERKKRKCSDCIHYDSEMASECSLRKGFINALKTFDATTCPDYSFDPSKRKMGSFCFLTTACVEYYGKPDDCYELETLRAFRDGVLMKTEDGKKLCQEYYAIAPAIVKQMKKDNDASIYEHIYAVILECIELINQKEYEKVTNRYSEMVLELKEKYSL